LYTHSTEREREKSLSLLRLVDFTIVPAKKERKEKNWTGFFLRTPLRLFSETTDVKNTKKKGERERKKDSRTQKVSLFSAAPAPPSYQVQRGTRKRLQQ
jgi:hypothetical protein